MLTAWQRAFGRKYRLTRRELMVAAAVSTGATNRRIAEELGIAQDTVKRHLHKAQTKTGYSNRCELAVKMVHFEYAFLLGATEQARRAEVCTR